MFYRVDYAIVVLLGGLLAGFLFRRAFARIASPPLARRFYVIVAILLALRSGMLFGAMLTDHQNAYSLTGALIGDITGFLFSAMFGLAIGRENALQLLVDDPSVLAALRMALAFTFVIAGIGKAFSMTPMTEFFTQSGYSVTFLKFITMAEIFGAVGLLLPWAFLPAMIGLTIDMFGAVLTHVHNGDSWNDSTGAIGLLIRLAATGIVWKLGLRSRESEHPVRKSILRVGAIGMACLFIAMIGSVSVRHFGF